MQGCHPLDPKCVDIVPLTSILCKVGGECPTIYKNHCTRYGGRIQLACPKEIAVKLSGSPLQMDGGRNRCSEFQFQGKGHQWIYLSHQKVHEQHRMLWEHDLRAINVNMTGDHHVTNGRTK